MPFGRKNDPGKMTLEGRLVRKRCAMLIVAVFFLEGVHSKIPDLQGEKKLVYLKVCV